jgi:tungstate transport system ATP-binding protein
MAEALIALRDITVRHGASTVLDLQSFEVHAGEVVVVIGPNGAGKSTLLRVMGLLQPPSGGKVFFCGERASRENSLAMRRRMASVFQEPLLLDSTVYANAALGLKLRGLDRDQIDKKLRPWLERLGIGHLTSRRVRTLSGGEAQRTSLARGLVLDPDLLLLDEPFSALDAPTRETLLWDIQEILAETRITTVMVTHELQEAAALGQRIGVLSRGKLLQVGPGREIFAHPASEEVAAIVGTETRISAIVEQALNGTMTVRFDGGTAQLSGNFPRGARVTLCVRSEDIDVAPVWEQPHCPIGIVHIRAKIGRLFPSTTHVRVALQSDCGRLIALLAKSRFSELGLQEGAEVSASFHCRSVHVI